MREDKVTNDCLESDETKKKFVACNREKKTRRVGGVLNMGNCRSLGYGALEIEDTEW